MPRKTLFARFWEKVEIEDPDGCWEWKGSITTHSRGGYGVIYLRKVDGVQKTARAHRVAYEMLTGPIPEGLVIDHLCRNRSCVNPAHMEAVTDEENKLRGHASARKTKCIHGHELTAENTIHDHRGWRKCRTCQNEHNLRWYHTRKVRSALSNQEEA